LCLAVPLIAAPSALANASGGAAWIARYGGSNADSPSDLAVSPDGSLVFVTGAAGSIDGSYSDYVTIAYDATTGATVWGDRYDGPTSGDDIATALAVAPDGSRVFVTGMTNDFGGQQGWATIAYDAHSGERLWLTRVKYPGPYLIRGPAAIAVTPDGSSVMLTGRFADRDGRPAWATLAYDTGTGASRWEQYFEVSSASGTAMALSPDGQTTYVAGYAGPDVFYDYVVLAYATSSGQRLGLARYSDSESSQGYVYDLAVSPDGSAVFVTGVSAAKFTTVSFSADLTTQRWASSYFGVGDSIDTGYALAVSPDGSQVTATGLGNGPAISDFLTITYDAETGDQRWLARPTDQPLDQAQDLTYGPDGTRIYVTGTGGSDYATVEYDAATGAQLRTAWLDGPLHGVDVALAIAASPDGSLVFLTGSVNQDFSEDPPLDIVTVAYPAG
jgi:WD40 repeat protein